MKKYLNAIYAMHSLRSLAASFIGVFIPIYLLGLNYSLTQVFVYLIVFALAAFVCFSTFGYFANYLGLRKIIFISFPFLFLYVAALYYLDRFSISIYLISALHGASASLYYVALHNFFIEHSREEDMGVNVGKFFAFPKLITVFAPLIGGLLVVSGGFNKLILAVALFYLLSMIPLYFIPDIKPDKLDFRHVFRFLRKYPNYYVGQLVKNITEEMELIIWPIFIFLTFKNILSVGLVGSLIGAGSFLFMIIIGKYSDKVDKTIFLKVGGVIVMAIWILRYYAVGEMTFYVLSILAGFFGALLLVPFNSIAYSLAKRDTVIEFVVFREIPITLARVIVYSMAIIFVDYLEYLFIFTAFLSAYFLFFKEDRLN